VQPCQGRGHASAGPVLAHLARGGAFNALEVGCDVRCLVLCTWTAEEVGFGELREEYSMDIPPPTSYK
jgi:hypothetical protein